VIYNILIMMMNVLLIIKIYMNQNIQCSIICKSPGGGSAIIKILHEVTFITTTIVCNEKNRIILNMVKPVQHQFTDLWSDVFVS